MVVGHYSTWHLCRRLPYRTLITGNACSTHACARVLVLSLKVSPYDSKLLESQQPGHQYYTRMQCLIPTSPFSKAKRFRNYMVGETFNRSPTPKNAQLQTTALRLLNNFYFYFLTISPYKISRRFRKKRDILNILTFGQAIGTESLGGGNPMPCPS